MSIWRFLGGLLAMFFGFMAQAQLLSQAQEAERLRAAGLPIMDVDARLNNEEHQQILLEIEWLQTCCELDLILVLQDQSLRGSSLADLRQLQQQLLQADLWTDQTLILLIQSTPPLAEVAHTSTLQADISALSPEALTELGRQAGTPAMVPKLIQLLRAVSQAGSAPNPQQERSSFLSHERFAPVWHLGVCLAAFLLALIDLLLFRRLPSPLAEAPRASEVLPRHFGAAYFRAQSELKPTPPVLLISIASRRRHLGLGLTIAGLGALGLWMGQEILGGSVYKAFGFDGLQQLWFFRALVSVSGAGGLFLIFSLTPIGAWLTPAGWQRHLLARQLRRMAAGFSGPILVWRQVPARLELWQDVRQEALPETFIGAFERLIQDAVHGHADQGLAQFQSHVERYLSTR